jgi:hypothetical protein
MEAANDKNEENDCIGKSNEKPLESFERTIKHLMRSKADFEVVEGFLNELLKRRPVKITVIFESGSNKAHSMDKYNCVDIVVETKRLQNKPKKC